MSVFVLNLESVCTGPICELVVLEHGTGNASNVTAAGLVEIVLCDLNIN